MPFLYLRVGTDNGCRRHNDLQRYSPGINTFSSDRFLVVHRYAHLCRSCCIVCAGVILQFASLLHDTFNGCGMTMISN